MASLNWNRSFYLVLMATVCLSSRTASAEQPDHVLDLWPGQPPGDVRELGPEADMTKDDDRLIAGRRIIKLGNVTKPQAHVFLPPANLRTGASVVICPGGGFSILAWDLEGTEVAQWLNTLGVAGIVLKYRVPTRDQDPRWMAPTQDAQRTLSLVRHHAEDWQLDPKKVALMGFSAGGSTAIKATFAPERYYEPVDEADEQPCRPDRVILIYSPGLRRAEDAEGPEETDATEFEENVTAQTPPMFMVHAFDDFLPVEGSLQMMLELKRAGIPSELHVYDAGGHGYGLRHNPKFPVTTWTTPCEHWLRRAGWID